MSDRILFVDDDENLLKALHRNLRKEFDIVTAPQGLTAMQMLLKEGPFSILVTDMRMPAMTGIELLSKAKSIDPQMVRIMLTGNADMETAVNAVNEGQIFRFLMKPCRASDLATVLRDGLEFYHLRQVKSELLEETVRGSVKVLTEMLSLTHPIAFSRAERMGKIVRHLALELNLEEPWEFETAAHLSQLGSIILSPALLEKEYEGKDLNPSEREQIRKADRVSHDMVCNIPYLEKISLMIAGQQTVTSNSINLSHPSSGDRIQLGAYLLRVARVYDHKWLNRGPQTESFPQEITSILDSLDLVKSKKPIELLTVDQLRIGYVLQDSVHSKSGSLLAARGQTITNGMLEHLRAYARSSNIVEPIRVTLE